MPPDPTEAGVGVPVWRPGDCLPCPQETFPIGAGGGHGEFAWGRRCAAARDRDGDRDTTGNGGGPLGPAVVQELEPVATFGGGQRCQPPVVHQDQVNAAPPAQPAEPPLLLVGDDGLPQPPRETDRPDPVGLATGCVAQGTQCIRFAHSGRAGDQHGGIAWPPGCSGQGGPLRPREPAGRIPLPSFRGGREAQLGVVQAGSFPRAPFIRHPATGPGGTMTLERAGSPCLAPAWPCRHEPC